MSVTQTPYFTPDNGGAATPERYATHRYLDYQKNSLATITGDEDIQAYTTLDATQLEQLIAHVDAEMKSAGLTDGFAVDLGDINGDGTGDGNSSGKDAATMLGNVVKTKKPSVTQADDVTVERVELYTNNERGLRTTHTDPEGNVTAYIYYPENDPEGDGQYVSDRSNNQYGRLKETHRDIDPALIMTLIGEDGDLVDFDTTVEPRYSRDNTPGVYQNVVTGNEATAGCATCSYDAMGNVLSQTDARGFTTTYDRDELGRVYRVTLPAPYNFRTETYYDANGNVTRVDIEDKVVDYLTDDPADELFAKIQPIVNFKAMVANLPMKAGDGGTARPGWFTSLFEYDLIDNKISEDVDATGSGQTSLVTTYEYDANSNLVKVIKPEGNIVECDYDERNLQIAQRVGYVEDEFDGIVTVSVYDKNGNIKYQLSDSDHDGVSDNNGSVTINDAFGSGEVMLHVADIAAEKTYDGFNRLTQVIDAIGNSVEYTYDPAGNAIKKETYGPVGGSSPTDRTGTDTLLARSISRYDEAGQMYESQQDVFIASGVSLPSSRAITHTSGGLVSNTTDNDHTSAAILTSSEESYVLSRSEFDRAGRLVKTIADNTAETTYEYDGLGRIIKITDALGNIIENTYDANNNVIKSKRTEICTIDESITAESFETAIFYDCMGQAVIAVSQGEDGTLELDFTQDNSTIFSFTGYDSRGNTTLTVDPKGNTSINVYDGAGRIIENIQHMRKNGNGDKGPEYNTSFLPAAKDAIRTQIMYDANSRQTRIIDNTGAVASGFYDTADRPVKIVFHDDTTRTRTYSGSLQATYTDENGSVLTFAHDAVGRKTSVAINKAAGVEGTTSQTYQYDGLGRLTQAVDTDGTNTSIVNTYYDSLSRVVEESQTYGGNTRYVTHSEFKSTRVGEVTYPNNRTIENTYDDLYRLSSKEENSTSIVNWDYFGPSRFAEMRLANGLCATWMNNARTQSAMQDGRTAPDWGDSDDTRFGYDGAGRMISKRFISSTLNGTDEYDDATPTAAFTTEYDKADKKLYERHLHNENHSHLYPSLDSKSRLREYQRGTLASGGESISSAITLANTFESFKWSLDSVGNWTNITTIPAGGSESVTNHTYNKLHQVINDGTNSLAYDANGNLTSDGSKTFTWDAFNRMVEAVESSVTIGEYVYDALGRRIQKTASSATTDFIYDGMQCVEERVSDSMTKQYVWGQYIDEVLQVMDGTTAYYPLQDLLYRTNKLTTDAGVVHESYDCDAYGRTLMFDSSSQAITSPTCEFIFTGRRYDPETGLYYYRARYYSLGLGKFISKDPLGYVDGMNLYEYVGNMPIDMVDSYGLSGNALVGWPPIYDPNSPACQYNECCDQAQYKYKTWKTRGKRAYSKINQILTTHSYFGLDSFRSHEISAINRYIKEIKKANRNMKLCGKYNHNYCINDSSLERDLIEIPEIPGITDPLDPSPSPNPDPTPVDPDPGRPPVGPNPPWPDPPKPVPPKPNPVPYVDPDNDSESESKKPGFSVDKTITSSNQEILIRSQDIKTFFFSILK